MRFGIAPADCQSKPAATVVTPRYRGGARRPTAQCLKRPPPVWSFTAPMPVPTRHADPIRAPEPFRAALAELVQIGMAVARMVGRAAEAETALAEAASTATVADGVPPLATSLAEAIEADRAAAAAGEARRAVIARTETVAAAFNQTARAIRRTILLAERLDRAWARPFAADTRLAMARRQIARAVSDAIAQEAEGDRAERLTDALTERLDSLDTLDDVTSRPAEDIIRDICRDLGLDPARMPPPTAAQPAASPPPFADPPFADPPIANAHARASPPKKPPT